MIVKQLKLSSNGLVEPIELPDEFQNDKELTAYAVEHITELLFNSVIPLEARWEFNFFKDLTLPQKNEVVELDVIYPDDLRIKNIDVNEGSISTDFRDTFLILMSDLSEKLLKEAGIEPLS